MSIKNCALGVKNKVDGFFNVSKNKSKISTEIIAGLITFLTMAYILTLNPDIIAGSNTALWASVFIATVLGSFIGTLCMSLIAKVPLAQAPGLGLNSMVASMIGGTTALGFKMNFGNAMLVVFISGLLFIFLTVIKINGVSIREKIFHSVPSPVRKAISVGIGLFIAFIGLRNSGVVTIDSTGVISLVKFNDFSSPYVASSAIVCLIGLFSIIILDHYKVKGSVIIGILIATLIGIPLSVTTWNSGNYTWKFWEYFANFFSFKGDAVNTGATFFAVFTEGFKFEAGATVFPIIMSVVSFSMVDMFDTMGTAVGCAQASGLIKEDGTPLHYNGIMLSDSIATCAGAVFGTSTVTTFAESSAGVMAGGKTGLTSFTTSICFLLSVFLLPLFASIPSAAACSALLYVGCLMIKSSVSFEFKDIKSTLSTFCTVALMPLSYSITNGIGFGIISYVLVDLVIYLVDSISYKIAYKKDANTTKKKPEWDLNAVCLVITGLFLCYYFIPTKI